MVAIHVPHQAMHFIPVTVMAVVVGTSDGIEPWRAVLVVLTTALLVGALVTEMHATSEAVKRCAAQMRAVEVARPPWATRLLSLPPLLDRPLSRRSLGRLLMCIG